MDEDYDIVPATPGDQERIAEFLRQTFFKYESLNMCIGAPTNRPIENIRSLKNLYQGTSLMVMTKSGLIIGVALNAEFTSEDAVTTPNYKHDAFRKISELVLKCERSVNLFELTGTTRGLYHHVLAVDPIAGGRGIGKALMKQTKEIAKSRGYQILAVMCTSHYSARIAQSIGMKCVYKLPYSEYKNDKGEPVFVPLPPHKEATVFVEKLC